MKYFLDNIKTVLVIIAVVMLIMLLRQCGKSNKAEQINKELTRLSDSLTNKVAADSAQQSRRLIRYQADSAQARQQVLKADSARYASESKLHASQSTVMRLVAKVEQYRYENDSNTVLIPVSENYIISCDSLTGVVVIQQREINEHQNNMDGLVELMNYEVILRDSLIEDGKEAIAELRRDFNAQTHYFNLAVKNNKPTGRLLGGLELMGNEINPLWGGGVVVAYQSKKGKQYQVGVKATPVGIMYEGTILITLIK
jgi:hypothetical protein